MAVHIIIDGYNFIRQSGSPRFLNSRDLQQEREFLISSLVDYKRRKAHAVTVVFDGAGAAVNQKRKENIRGIEVVFSPPGQTADEVIKRLAAREKERALVVTSDREISDFAAAQGAAAISSEEFENRLYLLAEGFGDFAAEEPDDDSPVRATTRKKGPSFRLSRRERQLKKKVRKL